MIPLAALAGTPLPAAGTLKVAPTTFVTFAGDVLL